MYLSFFTSFIRYKSSSNFSNCCRINFKLLGLFLFHSLKKFPVMLQSCLRYFSSFIPWHFEHTVSILSNAIFRSLYRPLPSLNLTRKSMFHFNLCSALVIPQSTHFSLSRIITFSLKPPYLLKSLRRL